MPLYNQSETPITGSVITYQRAELLVLRNQEPPVLECHESLRSIYPGGEVQNQSLGILRYISEDMDEEIPLSDLATFEEVPGQSFTAGQFYLMAASIYMHLARQRDAREAAEAAQKAAIAREAAEAAQKAAITPEGGVLP